MILSNVKNYSISEALYSIDAATIAPVFFDKVTNIGTIKYDDVANPSNVKPTEVDLDAAGAVLVAALDATQYQRDRSLAYPDICNQLDMLYWDEVNSTTTFKDAIQAVKDAFPKPV